MRSTEDVLQKSLDTMHARLSSARSRVAESESLGSSWMQDRSDLEKIIIPDLLSYRDQLHQGREKIQMTLARVNCNKKEVKGFRNRVKTNPGYLRKYWGFLSVRLWFLLRYVPVRVIRIVPWALLIGFLIIHGQKLVQVFTALVNFIQYQLGHL